jgi:predicted RNase H-like HicB family nuclease
MSENIATMITGVSLLTIFIAKDDESYMAKCPELDLITEMNTKEEALKAIVEMIVEYAEDYKSNEYMYVRSPNRAHHKPYIDAILACNDEWELMELLEVRYAHLHL